MTQDTTTDNIPPAIVSAGPAAGAAWAEFVAGDGLKPSTRKLYRNHARRFLAWLEPQGIGLAAVTRATVESYLDGQATCYQERMIYRTPLRRLFAVLLAHHAIPYDPLSLPPLEELKAAIRELAPPAMDDNPEMLDAGVVLLAGLHFGTSELMPISRFTGVAPERVAEFAQHLRANGVWTPDGKTAGMWDQEGGGIALLIDILVALGMVACRPANDSVNPGEPGASNSAAGAPDEPAPTEE